MSQIPTNIRVQFGHEMVLLKDAHDVQTTKSGVEFSVEAGPDGTYHVFASPHPDVVRMNKHIRPVITAVDWINTEVQ